MASRTSHRSHGNRSAGAPDGAPDVVVLVHGGLDRRESMARLASSCAELGPEVVRYDRRGYGTRSGDVGPHDVAANVEDLLGIIAGRRATVFGHSFGGVIALAAAASSRDVVGVATFESPLSWLPWWPMPAWATDRDAGSAAEEFVRRLAGDDAWESLPASVQRQRRAEGSVLLAELADCRRAAPFDPLEVTVPVRVGRGTKGREHHRAGAEELARMLPNATLVDIDGAGHFAHRTHAAEIARQLIQPLVSDFA